MNLLKGGNWQDGVGAGFLSVDCWFTLDREIIPVYGFDLEGLPDRWVKILMGQTNWIPKIVFEIAAKKKKKVRF